MRGRARRCAGPNITLTYYTSPRRRQDFTLAHLVIGCGYVGEPVALEWASERGHETWATTRSPQRAAEMAASGLKPIVCDVLQPPSLRVLPQADTVLYAVGLDRSAGQSMRAVYVD